MGADIRSVGVGSGGAGAGPNQALLSMYLDVVGYAATGAMDRTVPPWLQNTGSHGSRQVLTLAAGNHTILIPPSAGAIAVWAPTGNAVDWAVSFDAGATWVDLKVTGMMIWTPKTTPASFMVKVTGGTVLGLTVAFI